MAKSKDGTFVRHQKVVAKEDLPGVPAGTEGKIMLKTGFRWDRYRVYFSNGVEVPWLNNSQLSTPKEYKAAS